VPNRTLNAHHEGAACDDGYMNKTATPSKIYNWWFVCTLTKNT